MYPGILYCYTKKQKKKKKRKLVFGRVYWFRNVVRVAPLVIICGVWEELLETNAFTMLLVLGLGYKMFIDKRSIRCCKCTTSPCSINWAIQGDRHRESRTDAQIKAG
jgi:hypothetical protein